MNRIGFIGGSDAVMIMQGRWLDLWLVKTGRQDGEDLSRNIAVQLGVHTEDFNLRWFETENNLVLAGHQSEFEMKVGNVPLKGTVDAFVRNPDGTLSIVEAKHTNAYNSMDALIEYYMPQVQMYAHLADADGIYLSAIFGNNKWESAYINRDPEYFAAVMGVIADFWACVEEDREPIGVKIPDISIDSIPVDQMVMRDASQDNAFVNAAITYIENEGAAKVFEGAKKDLKQMVADNEREVYCDQLTIKRAKNGSLRITVR